MFNTNIIERKLRQKINELKEDINHAQATYDQQEEEINKTHQDTILRLHEEHRKNKEALVDSHVSKLLNLLK